MKKHYCLFFLFALFLIGACNKKDDNPDLEPNPSGSTFLLHHVADQSMAAGTKLAIPLEIKYHSGDQEPVYLSISGLPEGITAEFKPQRGTPTFNTSLNLKANEMAMPGTYPVKIIVRSEHSATKEYSFNLHLSLATNLAKLTKSWQLIKRGSDDNKNFKFEEEEAYSISESFHVLYTFNEGYTGDLKLNSVTSDHFTWSLSNDSSLVIYKSGYADKFTIYSIEGEKMIFKIFSQGADRAQWMVFRVAN